MMRVGYAVGFQPIRVRERQGKSHIQLIRDGTRFLIITHHRMTMARMDRLFGVTMSERGVSQLVSVDLESAEELRESA
ncbi:MAG: hypothetical protein GY953_55130, partial [bacterium]|nr:hypothetical protein [bacterium]